MLHHLTLLLAALALVLVPRQNGPGGNPPPSSGGPQHEQPATVGGRDCQLCRAAQNPFGPSPGSIPAPSIELERAENQLAFDDVYLRQREALFASHAAHWIVIAGGELLPRDAKGKVRPALLMADALAAADAAAPQAVHRFVFRVGEEGDVRYFPTINSHPEWIGRGFFPLFDANLWTTPDGVYLVKQGQPKDTATRIGQGVMDEAGPRAELRVSTGAGTTRAGFSFVVSTGFEGYALLGHAAASKLGLERFEIPGGLYLDGSEVPMRRARAHFSLASGWLDSWAPVGVRPRIPGS